MKKCTNIVIIIALVVLLTAVSTFAARTDTSYLKREGDALITNPAGLSIGSEAVPIAAGYFTIMNASTTEITNLTIAGASTGNLDMGGYEITNTGNVGIGTTSPSQILHVFSNQAPTTTVEFGDLASSTARTCFNVNQADGSDASFYFIGGAIVIETNACK